MPSITTPNTGRKANLRLMPMQPGDVVSTMADVSELEKAIDFHPQTTIARGVAQFASWHMQYYKSAAAPTTAQHVSTGTPPKANV